MFPVFIVGGGASLKNFNFSLLQEKDTICINRSVLDVPKPTYFVTMDYTFVKEIENKTNNKLSRESFSNLDCQKYFIVSTNNKYIRFINNYWRDTRFNYCYDLKEFNHVIPSKKNIAIGHTFEDFVHGSNSGFCAVQLALLLGYKEIYLLGIDLNINNGLSHYHEDYHQDIKTFVKRMELYYSSFLVGIHNIKLVYPDVKIYTCSHGKITDLVEYKDIKDIE
jgi:hypothetical protein